MRAASDDVWLVQTRAGVDNKLDAEHRTDPAVAAFTGRVKRGYLRAVFLLRWSISSTLLVLYLRER